MMAYSIASIPFRSQLYFWANAFPCTYKAKTSAMYFHLCVLRSVSGECFLYKCSMSLSYGKLSFMPDLRWLAIGCVGAPILPPGASGSFCAQPGGIADAAE